MTRQSSITELVSAALWRTRCSRGAECVLLGITAGILTACAAALSGVHSLGFGAWTAAVVSSVACGCTWWIEHRRGLLEVARAADERLEQRGALVTSFEREQQGGLAALLAARTLDNLPRGASARAAPGPVVAFVAAPLIAGALLAGLVQRDSTVPAEVVDLARRSAAQLAQSSSAGADSRAADLARDAAAAVGAAAAGKATAAEAEQALRRTVARLSELVSEQEQRTSFDPALWSARDLARAALGQLSQGAPARGAGATPGSSAATEVAPPLKNGGLGSTMAGSTSPSRPAQPTSSLPQEPAALAPEVGTVAGRWWPTQYDEVVARWLAARDNH